MMVDFHPVAGNNVKMSVLLFFPLSSSFGHDIFSQAHSQNLEMEKGKQKARQNAKYLRDPRARY